MSNDNTPSPGPGDVLDGKYMLKTCLGRGGAGAVFLARHIYMERDVAIKLLHPSLASNEKLRARFLREGRLMSKLRQENVVTVHEFGMSGDVPYLVMEYVQGETLRSFISKGPVPMETVVAIGLQVSEALAAAHKLGIVHRDLKPDNIILQGDGADLDVKVLDFGLAKMFQPEEPGKKTETGFTRPGAIQGTPKYAPPEQLSGERVDASADVYSLGVTLYEALCGEAPFEAGSLVEYAAKHMTSEVMPPRLKNPDIQCSDELSALLMKCLSKNPRERFHNGTQLYLALAAPTITGKQTGGFKAYTEPTAAFVPFKGAAGVGAAAVALVVIGVMLPARGTGRHLPASAAPVAKQILDAAVAPETPNADAQLDALALEGERAFNTARYSDAVSLFKHVLSERPSDSKAKVYLGLTYRRLGRLEDAVALFESLNPRLLDDHEVAYELAIMNAKLGRLESAMKHLDTATEGDAGFCAEAKKDPAFSQLVGNPDYTKIIAKAPPGLFAKKNLPDEPVADGLERGFDRILGAIKTEKTAGM